MGMTALNATVGLSKSTADPFSPTEVPVISVLPPTPDTAPRNSNFQWDDGDLISPPVRSITPPDITSQVSPLLRSEINSVLCLLSELFLNRYNPTEKNSWEAASLSAAMFKTTLHWTLSRASWIHSTPCFVIHFNVVLGLPSHFPTKFLHVFHVSPMGATCPVQSHYPWFEHYTSIWRRVQIMKFFIVYFSPSSYYLLSIRARAQFHKLTQRNYSNIVFRNVRQYHCIFRCKYWIHLHTMIDGWETLALLGDVIFFDSCEIAEDNIKLQDTCTEVSDTWWTLERWLCSVTTDYTEYGITIFVLI
jgi:hypothetical protein